MLRQNGFTVSDTGHWVYANASKGKAAFDWKLEFDLTLVPYTGDDRDSHPNTNSNARELL